MKEGVEEMDDSERVGRNNYDDGRLFISESTERGDIHRINYLRPLTDETDEFRPSWEVLGRYESSR